MRTLNNMLRGEAYSPLPNYLAIVFTHVLVYLAHRVISDPARKQPVLCPKKGGVGGRGGEGRGDYGISLL